MKDTYEITLERLQESKKSVFLKPAWKVVNEHFLDSMVCNHDVVEWVEIDKNQSLVKKLCMDDGYSFNPGGVAVLDMSKRIIFEVLDIAGQSVRD